MYLLLDASPLIYLAKLDAFDAIVRAGYTAAVPRAVEAEAARPELAFRHPEIARIERLRETGELEVVDPDPRERDLATTFGTRYGGLHAGELDTLAIGLVRGWPVYFHERQAARIARILGVDTVHVVEILFGGTPDVELLERWVRSLARLTNKTMDDLDTLMNLIRERR